MVESTGHGRRRCSPPCCSSPVSRPPYIHLAPHWRRCDMYARQILDQVSSVVWVAHSLKLKPKLKLQLKLRQTQQVNGGRGQGESLVPPQTHGSVSLSLELTCISRLIVETGLAYGSATAAGTAAGTAAAAAAASSKPRVVPEGYPRVRSVTEVSRRRLTLSKPR
jgi:hypothetical protein